MNHLRHSVVGLAVIIVGMLILSIPPTSSLAAIEHPTLQLAAPPQVEVGQHFDVVLQVNGAADIAAYETLLLFDPQAVLVSGLQQRDNDLSKQGHTVEPLGPTILERGIAFGAFTCPTRDCDRTTDRLSVPGTGALSLATITLVAQQPGLIELKLDGALLVDSAGNEVAAVVDQPSIAIQVGAQREVATYPAPSAPWGITRSGLARPRPAELTGDSRTTRADIFEIALGWELARISQAPCGEQLDASRDVYQDGCLDVKDIQQAVVQATRETPQTETERQEGAAQVFTVDSVGDGADSNIGNGICATASGTCTLRAAINEANALSGPNTILFNIPGSGVRTIVLSGALPSLSDRSGGTTIDGYSQPGSVPNSDPRVSTAVIRIEVVGAGEGYFDGLRVTSGGNLVRGIAFYKLRRPFWIYGSDASNNVVTGCFIGTNAAATYGAAAEANIAHGMHIEQGASRNRVGGTAPEERNVISGNGRHGVGLWHGGTNYNVVIGNIVGLSPLGDRRIPNRKHGLDLNFGASHNIFGGLGPGERNVVSGNDDTGVEVSHGANTSDNQVLGNFIGTDVSGSAAFGYTSNLGRGVMIEDGAGGNVIHENVIVNSGMGGIEVYDSHTLGNTISNNRIGVGIDGSALGNKRFGIWIKGGHIHVGPGNIIAYNEFAGIKVEGDNADFNTITQNSIYANGSLGIDLPPLGSVTPNDPGDVDSGANEQLNFPVLNNVSPTSISGSACAGCTVEVFVAEPDSSGHGEGKTYLGSTVTDANGAFTLSVNATTGSRITATATDSAGNTSEFSATTLIQGGSGGSTLASDTFSREVPQGWGVAEVGGPYSLVGSASGYKVTAGRGIFVHQTGNTSRAVALGSVSAQDVDMRFRIQTDRSAASGQLEAVFAARRVSGTTEYRGRIRFSPQGAVLLQAKRMVNGGLADLTSEVRVDGLTHTPNSYLWVRAQVVGTNPTTIRMRAWADGQTEPTVWHYTATDSSTALQAAGAVGLRSYVSSANAPAMISFDDFAVVSSEP